MNSHAKTHPAAHIAMIGCPVENNRYSAAISAMAKTGGTMRVVHRFAETTLTPNPSVGFESNGDFSTSAMTSFQTAPGTAGAFTPSKP